jgi:hypothetical protein
LEGGPVGSVIAHIGRHADVVDDSNRAVEFVARLNPLDDGINPIKVNGIGVVVRKLTVMRVVMGRVFVSRRCAFRMNVRTEGVPGWLVAAVRMPQTTPLRQQDGGYQEQARNTLHGFSFFDTPLPFSLEEVPVLSILGAARTGQASTTNDAGEETRVWRLNASGRPESPPDSASALRWKHRLLTE